MKALQQLVALSRFGTMVVGFQAGSATAGLKAYENAKGSYYIHDPAIFQTIWDQVGADTGTRWSSNGQLRRFEELENGKDMTYLGPDSRLFQFVVTRSE